MLFVNEIFPAIQGEGTLVGTPQVFVRLQNCNFSCIYCDSKSTWGKGGRQMEIQEVIEEIEKYNLESVCMTGGEPTLQIDSVRLCCELQNLGYYVSAQTNGSRWTPLLGIADKICMDMKPPSLGEDGKLQYSNLSYIKKLDCNDEVKVLIGGKKELNYAHLVNNIASRLGIPTILQIKNNIYQNTRMDLIRKYKDLVDTVIFDGFKAPYRILPQLHVLIWGNERRK